MAGIAIGRYTAHGKGGYYIVLLTLIAFLVLIVPITLLAPITFINIVALVALIPKAFIS